jgi:hypothetical protein
VRDLGFHHGVNEFCDLLGFYKVYNGSFLPTFRDNVSVPYSSVRQSKKTPEDGTGTDRLS